MLRNVNWDYVSLPCLLDLVQSNAQFRANKFFHQTLHNQFLSRQGLYNIDDNDEQVNQEQEESEHYS